MENATKALLIAGAILIVILLISVGIMVFNSASDPLNQGQKGAESQAVQIFNNQFTSYLGQGMSAQAAKNVITAVQASNSKDEDHQVIIDTSTNVTKVSDIQTKYKYNITETFYDGTQTDATSENGYICKIKIEKANKTTT